MEKQFYYQLHYTKPYTAQYVVKESDKHIAFDVTGLNNQSIGKFDSIVVEYTSNIDLSIVVALLPEDKHGFSGKKVIPKSNTKTTFSIASTDFSEDWEAPVISIDSCNNIAFGNQLALKANDSIQITISRIRLY